MRYFLSLVMALSMGVAQAAVAPIAADDYLRDWVNTDGFEEGLVSAIDACNAPGDFDSYRANCINFVTLARYIDPEVVPVCQGIEDIDFRGKCFEGAINKVYNSTEILQCGTEITNSQSKYKCFGNFGQFLPEILLYDHPNDTFFNQVINNPLLACDALRGNYNLTCLGAVRDALTTASTRSFQYNAEALIYCGRIIVPEVASSCFMVAASKVYNVDEMDYIRQTADTPEKIVAAVEQLGSDCASYGDPPLPHNPPPVPPHFNAGCKLTADRVQYASRALKRIETDIKYFMRQGDRLNLRAAIFELRNLNIDMDDCLNARNPHKDPRVHDRIRRPVGNPNLVRVQTGQPIVVRPRPRPRPGVVRDVHPIPTNYFGN